MLTGHEWLLIFLRPSMENTSMRTYSLCSGSNTVRMAFGDCIEVCLLNDLSTRSRSGAGMPVSMTGAVTFVAVHHTLLKGMIDYLPKKNNGSHEVAAITRSSRLSSQCVWCQVPEMMALTAGIWASRIAQLITYPFDTLRHRMQASQFANGSARHQLKQLMAEGGAKQLYRGVCCTVLNRWLVLLEPLGRCTGDHELL